MQDSGGCRYLGSVGLGWGMVYFLGVSPHRRDRRQNGGASPRPGWVWDDLWALMCRGTGRAQRSWVTFSEQLSTQSWPDSASHIPASISAGWGPSFCRPPPDICLLSSLLSLPGPSLSRPQLLLCKKPPPSETPRDMQKLSPAPWHLGIAEKGGRARAIVWR